MNVRKRKLDTPKLRDAKMKQLIKLRALKSKLDYYCDQLVSLGFNSSNYDLLLIKKYLPSSLKRLDTLPRFVIKKQGGYMVLASEKIKFLDLSNYVAAGTSLDALYKAYGVSVSKAEFPYEWFTDLEKLKETSLPPKSFFYSTLTNDVIDDVKYNESIRIYEEMEVNGKTFADYVRYYNDIDVVGMVEVIERMLKIYNDKGLDPFKTSVSLTSLTQQYLFKNLKNDYFVTISREHQDLYKLLKSSIVGGPSIIFRRYHERDETWIRNGSELCKKVLGWDCSSMYLYCLAQLMPTGNYSRRKKPDFKRESRFSNESIQWLSYISKEKGVHIQHGKNRGEVRIENCFVDG